MDVVLYLTLKELHPRAKRVVEYRALFSRTPRSPLWVIHDGFASERHFAFILESRHSLRAGVSQKCHDGRRIAHFAVSVA